jgi:signal transduction histidine kinase
MRRIYPRTLFGQLMLGTVLVQALLLGAFIWYTVVSQRQAAQGRTRERIAQQLDRLAAACADSLKDGNMSAVRDALELSRIAPSIEVARLTDLQGKTLSVTENGASHGLDAYELAALPTATRQQVFRIKNGQQEAVTPVLVDGKPAALLWLEPNHTVSLNTVNIVVQVALTYGGFALLANFLPIFIVVRTVTRPLRVLQQAASEVIRDPSLNGGFPLPVTTINEAGELTATFNTMVHELDEQRSDLLETLAQLDSLLENAPIGFAFFDTEMRSARLNHFLADMFDVPAAGRPIGHRLTEIVSGPMGHTMQVHLEEVFDSGKAIRNVVLSDPGRVVHGFDRSWLLHFYPVRPKGEAVRWAGMIAVEITERLRAEDMLRKTEKLAATGRLAASIAHEINNPLEAVTNLLYLLESHDPMDPAAQEFIRTAQHELHRVSEITQQTLRFYRQPTAPTRTNVADLLDSVVRLYQPRLMAGHIDVSRKFFGDPTAFGFSGELRQVFANLVGNAIDAMPEGGRLRIAVRPGHGTRHNGRWTRGVRVFVTDTGTGMSQETLRRVFEAFFTTKQATGTGLGLWVSEEIVHKHSGVLRVRSRTGPHSWTSFTVFLPDDGLPDAAPAPKQPAARVLSTT